MPATHYLRSFRLAIATATMVVCFVAPALAVPAGAPSLTFLGKNYHLGSYNQKSKPMWEFTSTPETVNKWSTLVTVIDRTDAASMTNLDGLAEGTLTAFKNSGAKILIAQTMKDRTGKPYNYIVAAIDEPQNHRYELNFLKIGMGVKNAYILIYGARITDPVDYKAKAAKFVENHSRDIGLALDAMTAPDMSRWPRTTF